MTALAELLGDSPAMAAVRDQVVRVLRPPSGPVRRPAADPDPRGDGHWQGPARRRHPPRRPPRRRAVRRRQLCRDPRDPARGRAVRLRAGRVHRRAAGQAGPVPDGQRRHHLPRRGRAAAAGPAVQAAAGRSRSAPCGGWEARAASRSTLDGGGDQRGPGRRGPGPPIPRGSLPPAGRRHPADASAPGARR